MGLWPWNSRWVKLMTMKRMGIVFFFFVMINRVSGVISFYSTAPAKWSTFSVSLYSLYWRFIICITFSPFRLVFMVQLFYTYFYADDSLLFFKAFANVCFTICSYESWSVYVWNCRCETWFYDFGSYLGLLSAFSNSKGRDLRRLKERVRQVVEGWKQSFFFL